MQQDLNQVRHISQNQNKLEINKQIIHPRRNRNFQTPRVHFNITQSPTPTTSELSIEPKPSSLQISINFDKIYKLTYSLDSRIKLPDTLSRNTPPELITRKTTVEIPQNIKFYLAKNKTSPRLECKYAVKTDLNQSQINNLQYFPLYLDCPNNHYEVDL